MRNHLVDSLNNSTNSLSSFFVLLTWPKGTNNDTKCPTNGNSVNFSGKMIFQGLVVIVVLFLNTSSFSAYTLTPSNFINLDKASVFWGSQETVTCSEALVM